MPTRRDTQGVMSCELITYGILLVVSDLPVCREMFGCVKGVAYIENESTDIDLKRICAELDSKDVKAPLFSMQEQFVKKKK